MMISIPACKNKVYVDTYCHTAEAIELDEKEIGSLRRTTREKIRVYNCVCANKSCKGIK